MDAASRDVKSGAIPAENRDEQALNELMSLLYSELRRLASHYLLRERGDHTLQATALVHEAYLRLAEQKVHWAFS